MVRPVGRGVDGESGGVLKPRDRGPVGGIPPPLRTLFYDSGVGVFGSFTPRAPTSPRH